MKHITIQLNDVHDLFEAPQSDPFSPAWLDRAGLEYITEPLKTYRLPNQLKVTLQLPRTLEHSDAEVKQAIARYAQAKIDEGEA